MVTEDELQRLRLRYQAAYFAHQDCMIALALAGDRVSKELFDEQRRTLDELTTTRQAYSDALVRRADALAGIDHADDPN